MRYFYAWPALVVVGAVMLLSGPHLAPIGLIVALLAAVAALGALAWATAALLGAFAWAIGATVYALGRSARRRLNPRPGGDYEPSVRLWADGDYGDDADSGSPSGSNAASTPATRYASL